MRKIKTEIAAIFTALMLSALSFGLFYIERCKKENSVAVSGKISGTSIMLNIVDGYTMKPLENAVAVLPEDNITAVSKEDGCAVLIIPENSDNASPYTKNLIVYKEGYVPYALFNMKCGSDREIDLYMLHKDKTDSDNCLILFEAPEREWAEKYVAENQPSNSSLTY